jgi:hypothetical protein
MQTVIIDLAVSVNVCLTDHLIHLLVCELLACTQKPSSIRTGGMVTSFWKKERGDNLTEVGHDVPQLGRRDKAISVFVKDLECLFNLFLRICVLHLARHHGEELWEINGPVAICVDFVDHVLQLCLGRILA